MSCTEKKRALRISLALDDSIALEALLLRRLERLPRTRQNAWLQSLLVKGFCQECAEIRTLVQQADDEYHFQSATSRQEPTPTAEQQSVGKAHSPQPSEPTKEPSERPVALAALKAVVA